MRGACETVAHSQWTAVVGPSGSGKSSLVLAGVVPQVGKSGTAVVVVGPAPGLGLRTLAELLLPLVTPDLPGAGRIERTAVFAGLSAPSNHTTVFSPGSSGPTCGRTRSGSTSATSWWSERDADVRAGEAGRAGVLVLPDGDAGGLVDLRRRRQPEVELLERQRGQ
ncbi:hypothetical protein [Streptomyces sp. DH7]|uniref:nSTAND1 domain-containing NTPase n=1 Tax=Streptomyces sp. DH7 TaxID=2857006 RepID=UPI0035B06435